MKTALVAWCLMISLALTGTAQAGTNLIPGTGIPVAPKPSATISPAPSPDEQLILTALNSVTVAGTLQDELVALGLDRAWWSANLAVTVHSIPSYLPEGSEYDVFVDLVHPPTGEQTGCYAKAGTSSWVCIDGWGAVPSYPTIVQPADFVDALFPVAWHMPFGNGVGSSLQWDCMTLRENSEQAETVEKYGRMAGGAAAAGGAITNGAAVGASMLAAVGWLGTVAAPAGMVLAPAVASIAVGVAVVGGIIVAAVVAGIVARKAYEAGLSLGMGTHCPGCGAGYDPRDWTCTANAGTDLCTCTRVSDGAADPPGDEGSHGDHTGDGGAGGHDLTIESSPWSAVDLSDSSGCDQWSSNTGVDNQACESCSWYQEPDDMEPTTGGQAVTYGCDVCVRGDSPSLGDVRCWSIAVETP